MVKSQESSKEYLIKNGESNEWIKGKLFLIKK